MTHRVAVIAPTPGLPFLFEAAGRAGCLLTLAALPGVDVAKVEAVIDGRTLVIAGQRVLPPELRTATIHRLELPQGRFERRIKLPIGRFAVSRIAVNGCIVVRLAKSE